MSPLHKVDGARIEERKGTSVPIASSKTGRVVLCDDGLGEYVVVGTMDTVLGSIISEACGSKADKHS